MAQYKFNPKGVCSAEIDFEIDNGVVKNVKFTRGCNGNTQGIGALVEGMEVNEVIKRLKGIKCGMRNTSCPDQLAVALEKAVNEN